jgi:hypothetical protein
VYGLWAFFERPELKTLEHDDVRDLSVL